MVIKYLYIYIHFNQCTVFRVPLMQYNVLFRTVDSIISLKDASVSCKSPRIISISRKSWKSDDSPRIRGVSIFPRMTFLSGDLLPHVCYTRELHIAWPFSRSRRARGRGARKKEKEREREKDGEWYETSNEKRRGGWLQAGRAREKREVMSSAFAQPLTGLYESVGYIHAACWKPTGNTLGSYVTLLRHFVAREWYTFERSSDAASASRFLFGSPGHTTPSPAYVCFVHRSF